MTNLRWISVSLLAVVLVFAVACGGGDDSSTSGAAAPAPTATASGGGASTGSSAVATAPAATATVAQQSAGSTGTLDVQKMEANLQNVKSFKFNMTMKMNVDQPQGATGADASAALFLAMLGNLQVEGSYVAPDSVYTKASIFGQNIQTIQIGNESWTNDGSGWVADSSEGSSSPLQIGSPTDIFSAIPQEILNGAETSTETVNGFDTTRYHFNKDSLAALAQSTGESMGLGDMSGIDSLDMDIWITSDGIPVKMQLNLQGQSQETGVSVTLDFNLTDLNDPSIAIDRPI